MKYKTNFIWAAIGFVLSFFIGLLAHVTLLRIILRACLFAIVFFLVFLLINYLYKHYLTVNVYTEEESSAFKPEKTTGNIVDISLKDTEISDSPGGPQFPIDNIHKIITDEDISQKEPDNIKIPKKEENKSDKSKKDLEKLSESRVPDNLVENNNYSEFSSQTDNKTVSAISNNQKQLSTEENIDDLPDIENLVQTNPDSVTDVIEDSNFSTFDSTEQNIGTEKQGSKDTALMAQAIRTMLKKDEL